MPYFAAVFASTDEGWVATEADLTESEAPDDVTDLMREVALEAVGDPVLLLIEENDAWFAVVRLDGEEDPRIFVSDASAAQGSGLGGLLFELVTEGVEVKTDGDPAGDPTLLDDLGITPVKLLDLGERAVPTDALAEVAEGAGFTEELDSLRV
ncbi:tRNA adenosine deaminase-associated protein [Actinocorallia longicatena]|uniref:tRNA adenosine deaminase-associated protein n=1 Tax=Actinocorallia longicatena TaxID=111803 RepID=A0ABP6QAD6_9ACTN